MSNFEKMTGEVRGQTGGDSEGKPLKPYIPIEEVPDPSGEEKLEDFEKKNLTPGLTEINEDPKKNKKYKKREIEEQQRLHDKIMFQAVNFQQDNENVAHVGPEFRSTEEDEQTSGKKNKVFVTAEHEMDSLPRAKAGKSIWGFDNHVWQGRVENLKTIWKAVSKKTGKPKIERIKRGETRDVLHSDIPEETTWQDFLEDSKN